MEKDEEGKPRRPTVCSILSIMTSRRGTTPEWRIDRRHRRSIPHRLGRCGYIVCRNPDADDGLWRTNGKRQTLYVKDNLSADERLQAARDYAPGHQKPADSS
jgi:hypothetical protein